MTGRRDTRSQGLSAPPFAWSSDRTLRVELGAHADEATAGAVRDVLECLRMSALPGVTDIIPAYTTITIALDPLALDAERIRQAVHTALAASEVQSTAADARLVEIPYCAEGADLAPDLEFVAKHTGLTPEDVIRRHAAGAYRVAFLGFTPGFAYLDGLPEELATPRLDAPRAVVPPGSVGIAGAQTGVYPLATPGGWRLIGRTPLRLFDAARPEPALLGFGDRVRFVPISRRSFDAMTSANAPTTDATRPPSIDTGRAALRVIRPGFRTTVQDLGRTGHGAIGVATSGAADTLSLRIANRLVGNADHAAAIELTRMGGTFEFDAPGVIALAGAAATTILIKPSGRLHELTPGRAWSVLPGERVRVASMRDGCRAYLAVRGGIDTPPVLGSRATHAPSRLGGLDGRVLREGDALPIGEPAGPPSRAASADALARFCREHLATPRLRVTPGPHSGWFDLSPASPLLAARFTVARASDRSGLRLDGPPIEPSRDHANAGGAGAGAGARAGSMRSEAMIPGAVQITPSGQPIIIGPDGPTTGGYPVALCVAAADLPALGQLVPGGTLEFELISPERAVDLVVAQRAALDRLLPPVG